MGQLELASVPVKGWIIDPDVYGLLRGPSDDVCLLTNYGEVVHTVVITRGVAIVIDEARSFSVPILGGHNEVLDGVVSFQMGVDPRP